ncbi:FKBP-type peptidyl-prolyl cis-trans isomerase [Flavobacterium sp.]|uniref:FKBP-type peptidyl-prolyl cis-trans isomerase n=1 Tax=Flavobacterium sp. TaxID=239 RepID=UPI00375064A5
MNKFYKILFAFITLTTLFSCSKDNPNPTVALRDYTEQYAKDLDSINKFIDTHYMTVDTEYNVTFTKIADGGTQPSIRLQTDYPLQFKMVNNETHGVDYKIYYLKLREGDNERPSAVDSVHVSYRGVETIKGTQFDFAQNPVWFKLEDLVVGWSEIMPYFKTGTYDATPGPNPVQFENYGAGVMFLPSGVGYYNTSAGVLPAYSTLVFSFKLYELNYRDHDGDGILSKDEIPFDAAPFYDPIDYDSDGDDVPNYFDVDDDDDRVLTKNEIKDTSGNTIPFLLIPDCSGNTTSANRVKKHLDPACH